MEKFMKIPTYIPFLGIIISIILFIVLAGSPSTPLLITSLIIFHVSGWIFAIKFFISGAGFFSSVLSS